MCPVSTAGVVLAAGFSRRLGRPKQELVLGGMTLLQRAVQTAHAAGLVPIQVVLNPAAKPSIALASQVCNVVFNFDAEEGLASSIRVGVESLLPLGETSGAVLMSCDQIFLTSTHLRSLYTQPEIMTASSYGGKHGIPAHFPRRYFQELLQLRGDVGARTLLSSARFMQAEELLLDVDTEPDFERAKELFTGAMVAFSTQPS